MKTFSHNEQKSIKYPYISEEDFTAYRGALDQILIRYFRDQGLSEQAIRELINGDN